MKINPKQVSLSNTCSMKDLIRETPGYFKKLHKKKIPQKKFLQHPQITHQTLAEMFNFQKEKKRNYEENYKNK